MQGLTQNTKFHRKKEKRGSVFDLGILYQSVKIAEQELSFQERGLKMQRPDTLLKGRAQMEERIRPLSLG